MHVQDLDTLPIGQRCWFEHTERGYVSGELKSKIQNGNNLQLHFEDEIGRSHDLNIDLTSSNSDVSEILPPLRDPATIESHTIQDLIELSNLNTPSVLHAIATRYERQEIYTYSGIVLIAVNPFSKVPLYTDAFIQQYSGRLKSDVQPHLYGVAEDAYRCMRREAKNQTIIVSGESGAGKTVSAKYIMRYFATVEDADKPRSRRELNATRDGMSRTEEQIIATNPIMEAFGNAKTTRNDNSSRFGKYIEIMFDAKVDIVGARVRTYLLERSRVNTQAQTERNYHIFYQLCAGLEDSVRSSLNLEDCMKYKYLSQGACSTIKGIDDRDDFKQLQDALALVGIDHGSQTDLWRTLAAILHLGNAEITASRDNAALSFEDRHLIKACELLGVKDSSNFGKWIIKQSRKLMKETIESPRTYKDALVVRDSISKYLYNNIFQWLVTSINSVLAPDVVRAQSKTFIGVLDIYGFEHFQVNSFEQFCINYANEKLQQEFTSHVFKLEQEEYIREGITWQMIDFADNQACIDMIEDRTHGMLALLDEQSRLGAGSDTAFRQTLLDNLSSMSNFDVPKLQRTAFTILHYALPVTYESEGFLEKNRDTVSDQHLQALCESSNQFICAIINNATSSAVNQEEKDLTAAKKPRMARKPTLGSIFKASLNELMVTISSTNAHYIRCIKPNEGKKAWEFEPQMVLSQLTACGVLETIRISCAGYPSRWTFLELVERYYCLLPSSQWEQFENHRPMSLSILTRASIDPSSYQIGLTKIFFKPGVLAELENRRLERLNQCATTIQKNARMWSIRLQYKRLLTTTLHLQALCQAYLCCQRFAVLKQHTNLALNVQALARKYLAQQKFQIQLRHKRTTDIQSVAKGYLSRKRYQSLYRAAISLQKHRRGCLGRRVALQAKRDRGTVEAFKQKNSGLEQKIVSQAQDLQKHKNDLLNLQAQIHSMSNQIQESERRLQDKSRVEDDLEAERRSAATKSQTIESLESELASLTARFEQSTQELQKITDQSESYSKKLEAQQLQLNEALSETESVRQQKSSLQQLVNQLQHDIHRLTGGFEIPPAENSGVNGHNVSSGIGLIARSRGVSRINGTVDTQSNSRSNLPPDTSQDRHDDVGHDLTDQIMSILEDDDLMNNEVMYGMIQSLKIPQPSLQTPPLDIEVLFPAQLINTIVSEMWKLGYVKESERFLANVMQSIQQQAMSYEGEEAINPGAFWLSNVHEILSFVWLAEADILNSETSRMSDMEWQEYDRLLSIVKHDLESLEFNIYHTWMKELKKRLYRMIIPATIESQSLPGFITSESSRFFNKLLQGNSPQVTMDDLLNHFNKVYKAMKSFYLEDSIVLQCMTELLKLVGVTAFNDLLMRRNFLSWKRGLQINYNITRIEEWCKSHDMPEGTLQLEHLMQATKLLQLKKATIADIDILYDICWCLSNRQIHKLINQYYPADYENPLSPEILKAVASRVTPEETQEILLDAIALDDSGAFEIADARDIKLVTPHVPGYLSLLRIKTLLSLIERQSQAYSTNAQADHYA